MLWGSFSARVTFTPFHSNTHIEYNCLNIFCLQFTFSSAGDDYAADTIEIQFQIAPDTMCPSFTILEDTDVEPVETFGVLLETSDPAVQLTDLFATVSITDSTGIYD